MTQKEGEKKKEQIDHIMCLFNNIDLISLSLTFLTLLAHLRNVGISSDLWHILVFSAHHIGDSFFS